LTHPDDRLPAAWFAHSAALLVLAGQHRHTDWIFSAYLGASKTAANTVTIEPATGRSFNVGPIGYETFAFDDPVYYGGRLTFFLPDTPWLGVGIEFTHNKATADVSQLVSIDDAPPRPCRTSWAVSS
jgi:hypothetical protein